MLIEMAAALISNDLKDGDEEEGVLPALKRGDRDGWQMRMFKKVIIIVIIVITIITTITITIFVMHCLHHHPYHSHHHNHHHHHKAKAGVRPEGLAGSIVGQRYRSSGYLWGVFNVSLRTSNAQLGYKPI